MITPEYVCTMAAYNAEANRRVYAAAGRLPDEERRAPRGLFWGSIHGTLAHLLWADRMWMARFDGWDRPAAGLAGSADQAGAFAELEAARIGADLGIAAWAATLDPAWLDADLTWLSGASGREQTRPRAFLVAHLFNHQTHHRGQVHAALTAAGQQSVELDLFLVLADDPLEPSPA